MLVMAYALRLFTELMALAGCKRYLEDQINDMLGEQVLIGETMLTKRRHRNFDLQVCCLQRFWF